LRRSLVRSVNLEQIAAVTGGTPVGEWARLSVTSVGTDTRELEGKELFFALTGPSFDAHSFLDDALEGGAKAAVVSAKSPLARDFHSRHPEFPLVMVRDTQGALGELAAFVRRSLDLKAIGITGTTGKTCTKDYLVSILSVDNSVAASKGSFNNEVGIPLTIFGVRRKDTVLVAEMGARRAGDIKRLAEIVLPSAGLITNVGPGHLELFKTQETVARTKAELARCLPEDGDLLLNAADPWTKKIARETRARITRFGRGRGSGYRAENVTLDADARPSFDLIGPGFSIDVNLPAVGRHQVENAVAAAACAHVLGSPAGSLKKGLEKAVLSPWRTQCIECDAGYLIINDAYNANPRSMEAALRTLAEAAGDRRSIAVLGGMAELGAASPDFHRQAGRKAAELDIDLLVTVGRRARQIAAGAAEGGLPKGSVFRCEDTADALELLSCVVEPGDVILVKASRAAGLDTLPERMTAPAFLNRKLVANV
jgi:UDP-N-acetylmuramoyl-tripeptide--D-alanyl-D-alanine ligase